MMSKKLTFKKADLAHAVKSFGCTDYDKNAGTVRGVVSLLIMRHLKISWPIWKS